MIADFILDINLMSIVLKFVLSLRKAMDTTYNEGSLVIDDSCWVLVFVLA
eukprot:CAMPEP_0197322634 /NCGR_PEP_ID=MMETSP0891-20130614/70013_1 /TAXON_ID=44058 ORGANISM="Aureoumbra lagunensis, Strain CCMP1510" /NCGR_SAMPLE_ID=MMETSP0891 /ASSEMBLY_ACC=CAM_ASM_000534 /LENGTH=49 /DNA_ID=CAMNT_0042815077 /DNA_START=595 /DNA_END=744 /DNA_ORIENTATION=-